MRFTILSAALIGISGVAANGVATTTLTRTLQRVVETVTQTRASGAVATATGLPSGYVNGTGVYSSPAVTTSGAVAKSTGGAVNVHVNAAGMAAVAGFVGYLAL